MTTFIDFSSVWGLFFAMGGLLNQICHPQFRVDVGARVFGTSTSQPRSSLSIRHIAQSYINNTIFRFFGHRPFSLNSFYKSIALSTTFMFAIALMYYFISGQAPTVRFFEVIIDQGTIWIVLFFVTIFLLDWLSFVQP